MNITTTAGILTRAAELIGQRGWARGDYETPEGALCAYGAIREAATEKRQPCEPAVRDFAAWLVDEDPSIVTPHDIIVDWNDSWCISDRHAMQTLLTVANTSCG